LLGCVAETQLTEVIVSPRINFPIFSHSESRVVVRTYALDDGRKVWDLLRLVSCSRIT
jgi:hypothetical protein